MIRTMLVVLVAAVGAHAQDAPKGQRVFVCGHSFHVPIAQPLSEVAKSAGIADHTLVGAQFIGGSRVIQHWNLADEKNQAKKALTAGTVDVLTLSPHAQLPDEGVDLFTKLLLEHNPKARVIVQASWYPFDAPGKSPATFKNADRDAADLDAIRTGYQPLYKAFAKQAEELNAALKEKAGRQVVFLVPVGHAVVALREKVAKGQVPGIGKQSELFADPIGHGRPPVTTLATYCFYTAIYGKSPVGLPCPSGLQRYGDNAEKLNRLLQETAWDAVTAEPLSGVTK